MQDFAEKFVEKLRVENNLRWGRFLKNTTQDELSELTGILQSRISRIENGLVMPSDDEIRRIAKALNCEPNELVFELAK